MPILLVGRRRDTLIEVAHQSASEVEKERGVFHDGQRSAERKRWFERLVMLPISLGMVAATSGYLAHEVYNRVMGVSTALTEDTDLRLAALTVVVALTGLALNAFQKLRRK